MNTFSHNSTNYVVYQESLNIFIERLNNVKNTTIFKYTGSRLPRAQLLRAPGYNGQIFTQTRRLLTFEKFGYNEYFLFQNQVAHCESDPMKLIQKGNTLSSVKHMTPFKT